MNYKKYSGKAGDGMFRRQEELIKTMTEKELLWNLLITQSLILLAFIILSFIFFDHGGEFLRFWQFDVYEIVVFGGLTACFVIIIDFILMKFANKQLYDDGGINEKLFQNRSLFAIFSITLLVAFTEELLFRGLLQTELGIFWASIIFALLHFRYLSKWLLLIMVLFVSFLLGCLFEATENLLAVIMAHFLIDFISALEIRYSLFHNRSDGWE